MASISPASSAAATQSSAEFREGGAQRAKGGRREGAVEHGAGAGMGGRVGLQHEARRPPGRFTGEISKADATRRAVGLPVVQHRMHLLPARGSVDAMARQEHERPGVPHRGMRRERIVQEGRGKWINVEHRDHDTLPSIYWSSPFITQWGAVRGCRLIHSRRRRISQCDIGSGLLFEGLSEVYRRRCCATSRLPKSGWRCGSNCDSLSVRR